MQLVIAEKPSVARDLARVLGVRATGREALEGNGRIITWCIGHLVELEEPAAYDSRWRSWQLDTLPMLPTAFKLRPVASTRDQLEVVRGLLRDRRITEVVNACDAGREGELIFRYVYELAGCRLPTRRLWISSLTDEAIRQGFTALKSGREYDALADAARCRSEADWLVGMNATRAVTLSFRHSPHAPIAIAPAPRTQSPAARGRAGGGGGGGGRYAGKTGGRGKSFPARGGSNALPPVYSIGRVQTPTLAILVRREQAIRAFVPEDYWEVRGTFVPTAETPEAAGFKAMWHLGRRDIGGGGVNKAPITRFGDRAIADAVQERSANAGRRSDQNGPIVERLVQKKTHEPPPQLFDLTSLQQTANRRFGMSATRTLEAAQALYERHKILTYPRTDSRYLPRDQAAELPKIFRGLTKLPEYTSFAEPLLTDASSAESTKTPALSRRVFDDAKVHDHHAIIPTGKVPASSALSQDEQRIFDLVVRRFLGVFHPDAEFALTDVIIRVGGNGADIADIAKPASKRSDRPSSKAASTDDSKADDAGARITALPPPPDRFIARGRVRLVAGWQAVAGFDEPRARAGRDADSGTDTDGDTELPILAEGQRLEGRFETLTRKTRPPPHHSEASLLAAMESAGREIEDEALRAAMKETGLGTPATRASTIETLLKRGFIARTGKQVVATPAGIELIERLPVPTLASPELTGAWEARLVKIARGQDTRVAFMNDIVRYVREVIETIAGGKSIAPPREPARAVTKSPATPSVSPTSPAKSSAAQLTCPRCHKGTLIAGRRGWGCSQWRDGCAFVVWFEIAGRRLTDSQLRDLIEKGKTRKGKWPGAGSASLSGHVVLDVDAPREQGAARFFAG